MSEKNLSKRVMAILKRRGQHPVRIESSCTPGCPDINCVWGWIELKYRKSYNNRGYPSHEDIRPAQFAFLLARTKANGNVGVLIHVSNGYYVGVGTRVGSRVLLLFSLYPTLAEAIDELLAEQAPRAAPPYNSLCR